MAAKAALAERGDPVLPPQRQRDAAAAAVAAAAAAVAASGTSDSHASDWPHRSILCRRGARALQRGRPLRRRVRLADGRRGGRDEAAREVVCGAPSRGVTRTAPLLGGGGREEAGTCEAWSIGEVGLAPRLCVLEQPGRDRGVQRGAGERGGWQVAKQHAAVEMDEIRGPAVQAVKDVRREDDRRA